MTIIYTISGYWKLMAYFGTHTSIWNLSKTSLSKLFYILLLVYFIYRFIRFWFLLFHLTFRYIHEFLKSSRFSR